MTAIILAFFTVNRLLFRADICARDGSALKALRTMVPEEETVISLLGNPVSGGKRPVNPCRKARIYLKRSTRT